VIASTKADRNTNFLGYQRPVIRDAQEHIDYVPSQVVSEFFAQVLRTEAGDRLDGVAYPSAVLPGGRNLVIFPAQDRERQHTDLVDLICIDILQVQDWAQFYSILVGENLSP
jgi:hypothetical protein